MIDLNMDHGLDPSVILSVSGAMKAGASFITRENDYVLTVPPSHADAVIAAIASGVRKMLEPVPPDVTETQFIRATVRLGIIAPTEGVAYLARGELPAIMAAALDRLPEPARTDAMLKAIGSSSFSRTDDVFRAIIDGGVATDEQIDAVFRLAGSLT